MNATGFFTKSEIIKGEYQPTELDAYKASVDFACCVIELFHRSNFILTG